MKPISIGGHSAYQNRVLTQLRKYYPDAGNSLSASTWQILEKFGNLDLSAIDVLMQDRYSVFGPEPRLPSDMLRAILVSTEFKITSYTRLASDLKENHLHAIVSSFVVDDTPCSDAKYGRNVHLVLKDNPRLFNNPPRDSAEWKLEFNARTSAERRNKREKIDYKLEDGRYRSSMMRYCHLFAIMMCQHLDAWNLSKSSPLKDLFKQAA